MNNQPNPLHQKETEFHGSLQEFIGSVVSPDDPSLEPRERKGRPDNTHKEPPKEDGGAEPKEQP